MFATPATLPPPPTLPTNGLVVPGHPTGTAYPDTSLLISFNQPIMYCQPHSGILIGTLSQATLLPPPMSPHVENPHSMSWRNRECQFDKYAPKLDNPFLRHHSNFFPSYPPTMPGMPPLLPHSGPFSSLQGAFQPKASNPIDVAARPGAVPHTLLQKDPRVTDPFRTSVRKPGKWCAVHVQIAWQIYHHQQKLKQMHKLDMNEKLDLFSRPPAPGVFPGFPYPHDLARPLFTGSGHPAASPYGPSPHHSGFLPTSHLADPYGRSGTFGGLGNLSTSAFGGLGNPSLGLQQRFWTQGRTGTAGIQQPHHDTWNRLTGPRPPSPPPRSGPSPPTWSAATPPPTTTGRGRGRGAGEGTGEGAGKARLVRGKGGEGERQGFSGPEPPLEPVLSGVGAGQLPDQQPDPQQQPELQRLGPATRGSGEQLERQREAAMLGEVKVKESRSPGEGERRRPRPG
ncbi:hypothetical protein ANANG_G00188850 [Anguilla anguilla]|uniref:Fibrosin-like 1 n=1 Tax=Anguilla anguilla TaxID=7936 RepID=A0A9D3M0P4_ANGAN|nr:hypothetical protein ANANG_G00188850 [Anguilla anguilla]